MRHPGVQIGPRPMAFGRKDRIVNVRVLDRIFGNRERLMGGRRVGWGACGAGMGMGDG
jgi:hypothetical protein